MATAAPGAGERAVVAVGEGLKAVTHHTFLLAGQWVSGALQWVFHATVLPGYATARRARLAAAHVVDELARRTDGKPAEWLHALEARVKPAAAASAAPPAPAAEPTDLPPHPVLPPPLAEEGGAPTLAVSTPAVLGRWSPGLVDELRLAALAGIDSGVAAVVERCCRARPAADASSLAAALAAWVWSLATCGCARRGGRAGAAGAARPPTATPPRASAPRTAGAPGGGASGGRHSRQGVYGHVAGGAVSGDTSEAAAGAAAATGTPAAVFWPLPAISDASASCAIIDSLCGHPVQTYAVTTVDGYILTLIRIPRVDSAKVVFFQHGLLDSASAWVSTGNVHSLASRAYQAGYDVFLGNLRGSNDALGVNGLGANPADYGEEAERQQRAAGPRAAVAGAVADVKARAASRLLGRGSAADLTALPRGNLATSGSVASLGSLPEDGGGEGGGDGDDGSSPLPPTPLRSSRAPSPAAALRHRGATFHSGGGSGVTPGRSVAWESRDRSVSGASLESAATWATAATSRTAATGYRFIGASTDGVPVHQTLHPRQPEYWNYHVQDHALDVAAFMRHIRIIKALEARHRRPLRSRAASRDGGEVEAGAGASGDGRSPAGSPAATRRPTVVPPPAFPSPPAHAAGGREPLASAATRALSGLTTPASVDDWARAVVRMPPASSGAGPRDGGDGGDGGGAAPPLPSPPHAGGGDDIGAAADPAGSLVRSAMALVGDGTPLLVPVARIGLATRHDGVPDDGDGTPAALTLPGQRGTPTASSVGRATGALSPALLPRLPASTADGDGDGDGDAEVEGAGLAGGGGVVDATHRDADDVTIVGVGHSMGSCVLMLYAQMCRALGRPHWLDRCILLSPAGLHREIMQPAKWLLLVLYHAGVLGADRPFPMRSSMVQRLVARFMQDLKRMQATSDLVGLVGSWLIGGDRSRFVFRYVSFTDYPIGGSAHKVLRHGIQNFKVADFQPYDYGARENTERYGAPAPPSFRRDFGLLDVPMHFVAGGRDALIPVGNIVETYQLLHRLHPDTVTLKVFPSAGHLDFTLTLADDIIFHVMHAIQHPPHRLDHHEPDPAGGLESPASRTSHASAGSGASSGGGGCGRPARPAHGDDLRAYGVDNVPLAVVRLAETAAARVEMAPQRWGQWDSDAGTDHLAAAVARFPWLAGWSKLAAVLDGLRQEAVEMGFAPPPTPAPTAA